VTFVVVGVGAVTTGLAVAVVAIIVVIVAGVSSVVDAVARDITVDLWLLLIC